MNRAVSAWPLEVIADGDERDLMGAGDGLGGHHADNHAADQSGPGGGGNSGQIAVAFDAGFGHGAGDQSVEVREVGAGRNLGDDAAIRLMFSHLAQNRMGAHPAVAVHHGSGRLVATGFDTKNDHADTAFKRRRKKPSKSGRKTAFQATSQPLQHSPRGG